MLVRLPKSAISGCPIVLLCLISYANYTIYSFGFNVWLPKSAQGKRSLLIQECTAQLPHPCEASDKLIPHISPLRRKYCSCCTTSHEQVQPAHCASLGIPKKQNEANFSPEVKQPELEDCVQVKQCWFFYGSTAYCIQVWLH